MQVCTWHTKVCIQTTDHTLHDQVEIVQNIYSTKEHISINGFPPQNTTLQAKLCRMLGVDRISYSKSLAYSQHGKNVGLREVLIPICI